MIDLALLRIIKYKAQFDKVYRYIPKSAIDKRTKAITEDIKKYFDAHPDEECVDIDAFSSLFFTVWHKTLDKDTQEYYNKVLQRMREDASEAIQKTIINSLLELEFATDIANMLEQYQAEEEIELVFEVTRLTEGIRQTMERTTNFEFAQLDDEILQTEDDSVGLPWALPCMDAALRPIRGGDMVIVAAPPDAGKTSFLTFNIAHMSKFTDKPIVWLNNESKKSRILKRSLQSTLQCTNTELVAKQANGTMIDEYIQHMGGNNKLRVYDIHGWDVMRVEELLEAIGDVGLVVFDMLDNVKFPGLKSEARTDQVLEQMYQWARELSVMIDAPIIATSQVSRDGCGMQFPEQHMLKDSKVGKQGACDLIIMVGKSADPMLEHSRFISTPKNKCGRDDGQALRDEVLFDSPRGVYREH